MKTYIYIDYNTNTIIGKVFALDILAADKHLQKLTGVDPTKSNIGCQVIQGVRT